MPEAIKRMLAEKKAAAQRPYYFEPTDRSHIVPSQQRRSKALLDMIDKAAPYIDEGEASWLPSVKLKLVYWVAISSSRQGAEWRATNFITEMLDRARKLFLAGKHPNPWSAEALRIFGPVPEAGERKAKSEQ